MTKIGINGFGRIGRLVFRGLLDRDDLEVVAINNPSGVETAEYLLKYDTVHGRLGKDVKIDGDDLIIDGKRVHVFSDRDPEHLDWSKYGVEIVVESTGKLKDKEALAFYEEKRKELNALPQIDYEAVNNTKRAYLCLLYTSPSPRD